MLDFCDAAYRFFPPNPSPPLIRLGRRINRDFVLPGGKHLVPEVIVEGEIEAAKEARRKGDRLLFVINHPTHTDPQVLTEMHRRLGIPFRFMAAYDVFLRSRLTGWCMQRLGHFSIDREGSDRKAMSTAVETLKAGDYALDIFPEGNVYLTNDRVTPFLDGTAFIALKAQQALDSGTVRIVPVSLKFTHLTDCRDRLFARLGQLASDSGFPIDDNDTPVDSVVRLGSHVLASHLDAHGYPAGHARDAALDGTGVHETLHRIAATIVGDLESSLETTPKDGSPLVDRIRKIRSTIHQIRTDRNKADETPNIADTADKAILAYRILAYLSPYVVDRPTLDRFGETVERLGEDHYSKTMPRIAARRAVVRIHPALDAGAYLDEAGGKVRNAVSPLTADMESLIQEGIDAINAENAAPGAALLG